MVHDNQEGDRPHNLEATDDFLFVIATGASDAMSVIERPGWMRWHAGRRARCGKSERNRGEGRRPRRLLSFPMGGGTVQRGQESEETRVGEEGVAQSGCRWRPQR